MADDDFWAARRTSFGAAAPDYAAGRPHYPRDVLEWALPDGAVRVLDLAAGTGVITRGLLDMGLDVVAVEPLEEMRRLIPDAAEALEGTAESIPLADASVDAVLVGQAWHWFDVPRAIAEAHRVLRPGGTLSLMWNLLDADVALSQAVYDIVGADDCSTQMLDDPPPPFDGGEAFGAPVQRVVRHALPYDLARVRALAASTSFAILMSPDERAAMDAALRRAMPGDGFELGWVCECWRAERLP